MDDRHRKNGTKVNRMTPFVFVFEEILDGETGYAVGVVKGIVSEYLYEVFKGEVGVSHGVYLKTAFVSMDDLLVFLLEVREQGEEVFFFDVGTG